MQPQFCFTVFLLASLVMSVNGLDTVDIIVFVLIFFPIQVYNNSVKTKDF
ncbi:hypothetical protein GLYMA_16G099151v4 [Glycine max]|nr:hypothetical protein GLYMA_16G099151v4 [Glycine max]